MSTFDVTHAWDGAQDFTLAIDSLIQFLKAFWCRFYRLYRDVARCRRWWIDMDRLCGEIQGVWLGQWSPWRQNSQGTPGPSVRFPSTPALLAGWSFDFFRVTNHVWRFLLDSSGTRKWYDMVWRSLRTALVQKCVDTSCDPKMTNVVLMPNTVRPTKQRFMQFYVMYKALNTHG